MNIHAIRLKPGQDLKTEIKNYVKEKNIKAGVILNGVGSLAKAKLRLAELDIRDFNEKFDITSLKGTLSQDGCHIHISISDKNGKTFGGHLKEDSIIHTTAEIVLAEFDNLMFTRELDKESGFKELNIKKL